MYILMQVFKRFIPSQFGHYYTFYFDTKKHLERKGGFFLSFKNECLSSYILHCFKCNKCNTHFYMNNIFHNFNTAETAWRHSASSLICSPV